MKLKLIERKTEAPRVETFIFEPEESFTWQAGQYLHYVLHHRPTDDRGSDRWFTIASAPSERVVKITTRFASEKGSTFKAALNELGVGDVMEASVLEGDFVVDDPAGEHVFIAGGIGITPFRAILKEADARGEKLRATLLYANRDDNVAFKDELEAFAKNNPNLAVHYVIAPNRVDEETIKTLVTDIQKPTFYLSGPVPMVESLNGLLQGMGIPKERIKLDDFPGYLAE